MYKVEIFGREQMFTTAAEFVARIHRYAKEQGWDDESCNCRCVAARAEYKKMCAELAQELHRGIFSVSPAGTNLLVQGEPLVEEVRKVGRPADAVNEYKHDWKRNVASSFGSALGDIPSGCLTTIVKRDGRMLTMNAMDSAAWRDAQERLNKVRRAKRGKMIAGSEYVRVKERSF